ncbi:unnamed protein product [Rodentolepis nana]|uniref:BTB domain-containing protein n=1 Tax=Rodentolepis nana TaxID=102285 RepID=A0A158QIU1_RODNA|nr:unnamed protein product [Rodentolepis nana]
MGLGFCRFVERSRLYPHPTAASKSSPANQKGNPSMDSSPISSDNFLVGPEDRVQFLAEIFWVEEEIYTSSSLSDNGSTSDSSEQSSRSPAIIDLRNDLEDLLISQRLADIKVAIDTPGSIGQNYDKTSRFVDIKDHLRTVECDCSNCSEAQIQTSQECLAHKAILAGEFIRIYNMNLIDFLKASFDITLLVSAASTPKLMEILSSSERDGRLQDEFTRLVFRGSGLSPDVVPSFLQYVYSRKMDRNSGHAQLVTLLQLSLRLEMREFAKLIEARLRDIISTKNVCSILSTAIDLKTPSLVESCLSFVFR